MVQKIQYTDNLKEGTDKLNQSIDQSNAAILQSNNADQKSTQALNNSVSTQTQLDNIVVEGDSSVEAAQARVDSSGTSHPTLKSRIDNFEVSATQQLQQTDNGNKPDWSVWQEFEMRGVNVKWLGVKGDGVTDDRLALQKAIDLNLPLYFPANTHCVISDFLVVETGNKMKIVGSGKDNCSITQLTRGKRLFYINGSHTEIENTSLYGTGEGFHNEPEIENGALLDIIGEQAYINNCRFAKADYLGILIKKSSQDIIITNNIFEDAFAEDIVLWSSNAIIKGNTFKNSHNNAIVMRGAHNINIEANLFISVGHSVDACIDIRNSYDDTPLPCNTIKIHNNIFEDCYLPLGSESETSALHKNIVITNNIINTNTGVDTYDILVRLYNIDGISFNDNRINGGGTVRAILLDGQNVTANDNIINNTPEALNINADGLISADGNTFKNITGAALVIRGKTTKNSASVTHNKFQSVGVGISTPNIHIGTLNISDNIFKDISTVSVKLEHIISRLTTVGNVFEDGDDKAFSVIAQPSTWVKSNNINFDREFGANSLIPTNPTTGQLYYNVSTGLYTVYNGTGWIVLGTIRSGNTTNRPTNGLSTGTMFYDVTIQKPIWWTGTVWKDATGTIV